MNTSDNPNKLLIDKIYSSHLNQPVIIQTYQGQNSIEKDKIMESILKAGQELVEAGHATLSARGSLASVQMPTSQQTVQVGTIPSPSPSPEIPADSSSGTEV